MFLEYGCNDIASIFSMKNSRFCIQASMPIWRVCDVLSDQRYSYI